MTSSSSLYGTVTQQNVSSTNSTSLYGEAGTPIPDSSGNLVVRGDLYVLSGNILTTASTGNIFPQNATTINLGTAATIMSIGAGTGTTTINNALTAGGTVTAPGADFGNITIGVATDNTITTTSGDLDITAVGTAGVNIVSGNDAPTLITRNSNNTNTSTRSLALLVQSSGTPTVGFGNTLDFQLEAQPGNLEQAGFINVVSTDLTPGSEDFSMGFGLMQNGAAYSTKMSLDSTGSLTLDNDLTIGGVNINLQPSTNFLYSENNDRINRPEVQSTSGNSSGFRVRAPNTGTSAASTLSVNNSSDSANTEFLAIQARGSALGDTFRFLTGEYIANVFSASNKSISFTDYTNTYATVNPSGPTIGTDLTTKTYVDAAVSGGVTSITGTANQVIASSPTGAVTLSLPQSIATTSNVTFADITATDDLTVQGNNVNLAQATIIGYNENNLRANRPQVQSTSGNGSGFRVLAPNATTSATSNLTVFGSNDISNGEFLSLQATGSTSAPFSIRTGKYTAGVLGASSEEINIVDGGTTYASINPAGPTNSTDLTTKAYVDALPVGVTSVTGGTHVSASPTTGAVVVTTDATDANTASTIVARDASGNFSAGAGTFTSVATPAVSYTSGALTITGGAVAPSALTVDDYQTTLALDGGVGYGDSLLTADYNSLTWAHTAGGLDTGSVNGIWNLNSDGTTDFPNYTFPYADGTANQIMATDGTGNLIFTSNPIFAGGTFGNVTVGVDTDNTISTTSGNLVLQTAAGVNAGTITLNSGAAGNIVIAPDTTGDIHLNSDAIRIGDANATATLATRGTGNLVLTTNEGSAVEGTLTLANGANGNATFAPNGTGGVALTLANGGNLTNTRNYVFGAIRNATTASIGDIWAFNATGTIGPLRGVSLDNSADTTKNVGTVLRGYSGSAASGQRGRLVFEKARNTVASPAANATADVLGSIEATGYSSTGWVNDTIPATPGLAAFICNENWISNTNLGTGFIMNLAPTATTISTTANLVQALNINPQTFASRSDAFTWANGKTGSTQTMSLDVSGNLIVTGDVRVNGNDIQGSGGTTAISLTSANATTTVRGDIINLANGGNTANNLALSSNTATFANAGTAYATFGSASSALTSSGQCIITRTSAVPASPSGQILRLSRTDVAGPTDGDGIDFRLSVGGTATTSNFARFNGVYRSSGLNEIGMSVSTDSFAADSDQVYIATAESTKIQATPSGGGAVSTILTVDAAKITAAVPFKFPTYTIAAAGAITGALGWQISISDSPIATGRMAYWTTTATAGWRYVDTNLAI